MPSEAQQTHHLLGFFFEDRHQLKILAGFSPFLSCWLNQTRHLPLFGSMKGGWLWLQ